LRKAIHSTAIPAPGIDMLEDLRERLRMDNEPKESIDPRARKVW
jgi:hypothetical protein